MSPLVDVWEDDVEARIDVDDLSAASKELETYSVDLERFVARFAAHAERGWRRTFSDPTYIAAFCFLSGFEVFYVCRIVIGANIENAGVEEVECPNLKAKFSWKVGKRESHGDIIDKGVCFV